MSPEKITGWLMASLAIAFVTLTGCANHRGDQITNSSPVAATRAASRAASANQTVVVKSLPTEGFIRWWGGARRVQKIQQDSDVFVSRADTPEIRFKPSACWIRGAGCTSITSILNTTR